MQTYRLEYGQVAKDEIAKILPKDEKILHEIDVIPMDYRIANYNSPKFLITSKRLIFTFDEVVEIYNLVDLEILLLGDKPRFNIWQVILEQTFEYSFEKRDLLDKVKEQEFQTRLSINERGTVPKYFLVRSGNRSQKSMKTWALMQILLNIRNGKVENDEIVEVINGYFSSFNQKTVLYFVFSFIIYFGLKLITTKFPDFVGTILDVIIGIIMVLIGFWTYSSVRKNLRRYESIYLSYFPPN